MSTATVDWVPIDRNDDELKGALNNALKISPSSVITLAPDRKTNRFILQTLGYHDLYLYVVEGIKFTSSKTDFEKAYPKTVFATVDALDSGAYNFLRDSTILISTNTNDFNKNGLGRLLTSANGAIAYADQCIGLLKEKTDMSLFRNLDIILDDKYVTQPKDDAFDGAMELARMVVQNLSSVAKEKAKDAKAMVALLRAFHTLTTNDVSNVKTIEQDWLNGKPKPDASHQDPYCAVMDKEITRLQNEIINAQKKRDEEDDKWSRAKDGAISMGVLGVFFPWLEIGTAVETGLAIKAKIEYEKYVKLIKNDQNDKAIMVSVLELVRALVLHLKDLLPKMEQALKAMEELEQLFTEQDLNFQIIDQKLGIMKKGIEGKSLIARKMWILSGIDEAVEKFREVKALAHEFQQGAQPTIINTIMS